MPVLAIKQIGTDRKNMGAQAPIFFAALSSANGKPRLRRLKTPPLKSML
jgi:hypothetical protein